MSQKESLIKFLKGRTTTFTVEEVNAMVSIVNTLEEPKPSVPEGLEKRDKKEAKKK